MRQRVLVRGNIWSMMRWLGVLMVWLAEGLDFGCMKSEAAVVYRPACSAEQHEEWLAAVTELMGTNTDACYGVFLHQAYEKPCFKVCVSLMERVAALPRPTCNLENRKMRKSFDADFVERFQDYQLFCAKQGRHFSEVSVHICGDQEQDTWLTAAEAQLGPYVVKCYNAFRKRDYGVACRSSCSHLLEKALHSPSKVACITQTGNSFEAALIEEHNTYTLTCSSVKNANMGSNTTTTR